MNNILIIDTEATGLDLAQGHKVIEIAAVLFNVPSRTVLQQFSTLLPAKTNDAYSVNKIKAETTSLPMAWGHALTVINAASKYADAIIAHNAEFDKKWMEQIPALLSFGEEIFLDKPWICSCHDFTWPDMGFGGKRLIDIALQMGIPVVSAHRALTDCQLLAECFVRLSDLPERLERAKLGKDTYIALTSYEERELTKSWGFMWDKLVPKAWACKLSEEEVQQLPFKVRKL